MSKTQSFYRKADVSSKDAKAAVQARFPQAKLVSFETKVASADEARAARVPVGQLVYEATLKFSEFPPSDDGGGDEEAPEPKEPKDDAPSDDDDSDDGGDDAPEFGTKNEGGDLGEPKKMNPQEETVHLLHQILEVLKGGGGPPGIGDDLGAPDLAGGPEGPPGGPGGPPGLGAPPTKAPLPPPVKPKAPMGGPAFSNVNTITAFRVEASTIGNKALIEECAEIYPTHEVVKIRRSGVHELEGKAYDAQKNDIAVVTLERK